MKKMFLLFIVSIVIFAQFVNAYETNYQQKMIMKSFSESYAKIIANWAHPSAKFIYNRVEVSGRHAFIYYTFKSAWTDKNFYVDLGIRINSDGNIGKLYVKRYTGFVPPFLAMTAIKETVTEIIAGEKSEDEDANEFLEAIRNDWDSLDGRDLCELILAFHWTDKGYKSIYLNTAD